MSCIVGGSKRDFFIEKKKKKVFYNKKGHSQGLITPKSLLLGLEIKLKAIRER
jgi:hypothetical protein